MKSMQSDSISDQLRVEAGRGNAEKVSALLQQGANINWQNIYGDTPLHEAAHKGRSQCVELLLTLNAKMNVLNEHRNSPLHLAAIKGRNECVKLLLAHGCKLDIQNVYGYTALQHAVYNSHLAAMELILLYKADPNMIDEKGDTAYAYIMRMLDLKNIYNAVQQKLNDPDFKVLQIARSEVDTPLTSPSKLVQESQFTNLLSPKCSPRAVVGNVTKSGELFDFLHHDCHFSTIKSEKYADIFQGSMGIAKKLQIIFLLESRGSLYFRDIIDDVINEAVDQITFFDEAIKLFLKNWNENIDVTSIKRLHPPQSRGNVYSGRTVVGNSQYVIKLPDFREWKGIKREVFMLNKINQSSCPEKESSTVNLFRDWNSCPSGAFEILVLEHHGSDLTTFLNTPILREKSLEIVKQLVHAMLFLHSTNICHLNLQPSNVLLLFHELSCTASVKICDFEMAREVGKPYPHYDGQLIFNKAWVCPEVYLNRYNVGGNSIDGDEPLNGLLTSLSMDVFQLGLVVASILDSRKQLADQSILPRDESDFHRSLTDQEYLCSHIKCDTITGTGELCNNMRILLKAMCLIDPLQRISLQSITNIDYDIGAHTVQ